MSHLLSPLPTITNYDHYLRWTRDIAQQTEIKKLKTVMAVAVAASKLDNNSLILLLPCLHLNPRA